MTEEELTKHIEVLSRDTDLLQATPHMRPVLLQQASKLALGLPMGADVADMEAATRMDYLAILSGARNAMLEHDAVQACIAVMANPYGIME